MLVWIIFVIHVKVETGRW